MSEIQNNLLIHFDTNIVRIYKKLNSIPILVKEIHIFFNETLVHDELLRKIDKVLNGLELLSDNIDNKIIRLYATGVFQDFSKEEQTQLVNYVFVNFGLYFNIINKELETFYLRKSLESCGNEDLIYGLLYQEFRTVVICGSFQQNMKEITNIIINLNNKNIQVLSPWTTKVITKSLGTDFILLEGQELCNERDSWRHKFDHMSKFKKADAIIVCNPNGIIGKGTMFEFGFMVACSKRIIFTDTPKDLPIYFPYEIGLDIN